MFKMFQKVYLENPAYRDYVPGEGRLLLKLYEVHYRIFGITVYKEKSIKIIEE